MRLIPNWGAVLAKASSMWAVYGGMAVLVVDKAPGWLKGPEAAKLITSEWRDTLLGICLFLAMVFRVIQQQALATATERKLLAERIARERLEAVATSADPPITKEQVKSIKKDAAVEAAGVDP